MRLIRFCLSTLVVVFALSSVSIAQETPPEPEAPELAAVLTDPGQSAELMSLRVLPLTVSDLSTLAAEWQGIAKAGTEEVTELRLLLRDAQGPRQEEIRASLADAVETRNRAFEVFSVVVDALAAKGGDQVEIDSYRAYRNAVLTVEAQKTDWRTLSALGLKWAQSPDGGIALAWRLAVIVGALLGLVVVARLLRIMARRALRRVPNISKLLIAFLTGVVYWITMAVGLMVVLAALGVNITPVFALFGGAAFIIAFAMQDTLGNLAAGVMIIINRPFDEGDYVTAAGVSGTVQSVSIVSTKVTTPDNQVIVIPNSRVWGDIITNTTASDTRRVDLVFGIGYDDPIEKAQAVLERVVSEHPKVLADPAPVIRVGTLGASSVDFICRPWTKTSDYWGVYWDLTRSVKEAFDAEGISIPYPQTDMHLHLSSPVALEGQAAAAKPKPESPRDTESFASGDEGAG